MRNKKQKPAAFIPNDFIELLSKDIKGFETLPFNKKFSLAAMILETGSKRRQHYADKDQSAFFYQELDRYFGKGGFKVINDKLRLFEVSTNWQFEHNESKKYKLTRKTVRVLKKWLKLADKPALTDELVFENGKTMRKPPQAIAAKTASGNTAKNTTQKEAQIEALTPINMGNLQNYKKSKAADLKRKQQQKGTLDLFGEEQTEVEIQRSIDYIKLLVIYAKTDIGQNKFIVHRYVEHKTGRLYAQGVANLQNAPRSIRQAALQGFYDYDIENCHYALFRQLAARAGFQTPNIDDYLKNKKEVRESLADEIGAPSGQVKECLIQLIYGARRTEFSKAAIPKTLDKKEYSISGKAYLDKDSTRKFINHPFVKALYEELKQGRKVIIANQQVSRMGNIKNLMGCTIAADEEEEKILAHILQGIEAKILEIARELYGKDIILLQHDGFTSRIKLNFNRLTTETRDRLGYEVEIKEECLQVPESAKPR